MLLLMRFNWFWYILITKLITTPITTKIKTKITTWQAAIKAVERIEVLKNTTKKFGLVSIALHWLMAIILTGLFVLGLYMTSLDYYDPLYHSLPWWHKSFGLLLLILLILRFIWKISNPKPEALKTHKQWEIKLAHLIQSAFYVLILLTIILGYLISTAKGKGVEFFTLFEFPAITEVIDEEIVDMIGNAHLVMALLLATLVVLHAAAALKHHFLDKDETLKRMINR